MKQRTKPHRKPHRKPLASTLARGEKKARHYKNPDSLRILTATTKATTHRTMKAEDWEEAKHSRVRPGKDISSGTYQLCYHTYAQPMLTSVGTSIALKSLTPTYANVAMVARPCAIFCANAETGQKNAAGCKQAKLHTQKPTEVITFRPILP